MTIRFFMRVDRERRVAIGWSERLDDLIADRARLQEAVLEVSVTKLYRVEKDVSITEVTLESIADRVSSFNLRTHQLPVTDRASILLALSVYDIATITRGLNEISSEQFDHLVKAALTHVLWSKSDAPSPFPTLANESDTGHE